jgi:hypothetical protein
MSSVKIETPNVNIKRVNAPGVKSPKPRNNNNNRQRSSREKSRERTPRSRSKSRDKSNKSVTFSAFVDGGTDSNEMNPYPTPEVGQLDSEFVCSTLDPCGSQGHVIDPRPPDGSVPSSLWMGTREIVVLSPPVVDTDEIANRAILSKWRKLSAANRLDVKFMTKWIEDNSPDGNLVLLNRHMLHHMDKVLTKGTNLSRFMDSIPLDGSLVSWCYFLYQGFRANQIVLAKIGGGSFGNSERLAFCRTWNSTLDYTSAIAPSWLETEQPGLYFTIQLNPATKNIREPTTARTSDVLVQWRNCNSGVEMFFNAPELINQGVYATAQINLNTTHVSPPGEGRATAILNYVRNNPVTGQLGVITWQSGSLQVVNPTLGWRDEGETLTLTSNVQIGVRNAQGVIELFAEAGDQITYTSGAGGGFGILEVSSIHTSPIILRAFATGGNIAATTYVGIDTFVPAHSSDYTLVNLPPSIEGAMAQLDPKFAFGQLNRLDGGGYYSVSKTHEPVFNWQVPANRRPIKFWAQGITSEEMDAAPGGFPDTIDPNFNCITHLNLGCAGALAPGIKVTRDIEIVPQQDSELAPFSRPAKPCSSATLDVYRTMQSALPHTYDASANLLGTLGKWVSGICTAVIGLLGGKGNASWACQKALECAGSIINRNGSREAHKPQQPRRRR